jgi:GT2 family glycosyltransferase
MKPHPFISVVIPVYNAANELKLCLQALNRSDYSAFEILVVDDGSTDDSAVVAQQHGARVCFLHNRSGPAAARNLGVENAVGQIMLFIDSDVLVKEDTISRTAARFVEDPETSAIFGSYDDRPTKTNFISQYKNLLHHFVHQMSDSEAVTFWAGCGAVRKSVFRAVGGFDKEKYSMPCIEDIEMGYRIKKLSHRILLDKKLQVTHMKKWTFQSLLHADIFCRAIPWTKLMLESGQIVSDLNLQLSQRISAALTGLTLLCLLLSLYVSTFVSLIPIFLLTILLINYKMFYFFLIRRGFFFMSRAFIMQLLYYFYSGIVFAVYWILHKVRTY